jgi:regulator of protease activity HflC (stomatin/prohibitin superfamily)
MIKQIIQRNIFIVKPESNVSYYKKTFTGRIIKLLPDFYYLNIPIIHDIRKIHDTDRKFRMMTTSINCFTKDNYSVAVTGDLSFNIVNDEKALFTVRNYHNSIQPLNALTIKSTFRSLDFNEIISDRVKFNDKSKENINKIISDWGIYCYECRIYFLYL